MSPGVLAGIVLLVLANSLYVAAEFGAVGVRRSRVRRLAEDGHRGARRLLPFVEQPAALDRYVGASQIGITLSSLALGAMAQAAVTVDLAPVVAAALGLDAAAVLPATALAVLLVLTAAQLVVGELVPKSLALQYPTQVALVTIWPMRWSLYLFRPFLVLLNGSATLLLRLAGVGAQQHRHLHSPEEIDLLIAESRDGGLLEPDEQQRLHRALRLGRRRARDLMVPAERLTMLPIDADWDQVVRTVSSGPFSRIPVFRGTSDHIVGTLRVKDLAERFIAEGPRPLDRLMHPVPRVPESLPADRVISLLRERRTHQAVVVDAGDRTIGLVTIQDVLDAMLRLQDERTVPPLGGRP